MSENTTALALCGGAIGVSMFYQIRQDRDPIPVFVIGGIFTGVVVTITAVNADVGTALAAVFFLGMFLTRGSELIDWIDAASGGASKDKKRKRNHG